jgi:hypothetical protein
MRTETKNTESNLPETKKRKLIIITSILLLNYLIIRQLLHNTPMFENQILTMILLLTN